MSTEKNELTVPGVTETIKLIAFKQLRGSPVETAALRAAADIIEQGWQPHAPFRWEDKVAGATINGEVVAFIVYRLQDDGESAYVALGYTVPEWRKRGIYKALWRRFAASVAATYPELKYIESGYHAGDKTSAAMHEALGRHPAYICTQYDLSQDRKKLTA